MCVGFPLTDMVLEVADEDEIYNLQFGRFFEEQALDPNAPSVQRDDYAIELALLDE
jgi:ferredoxin